jgi:hypothetical protein
MKFGILSGTILQTWVLGFNVCFLSPADISSIYSVKKKRVVSYSLIVASLFSNSKVLLLSAKYIGNNFIPLYLWSPDFH